MAQRRYRTRLPLESCEGLLIIQQVFGEELKGNRSPQAKVLSLVDDTHAAGAELSEYSVVGDSANFRRVGAGAQHEDLRGSRRRLPLFRRHGSELDASDGPVMSLDPAACTPVPPADLYHSA